MNVLVLKYSSVSGSEAELPSEHSLIQQKNSSSIQCCKHRQSMGALCSWSLAGPVSQQPLPQRPDSFGRRRLSCRFFKFGIIGCFLLTGRAVFQPAHHHLAAGRSLRRSLKKVVEEKREWKEGQGGQENSVEILVFAGKLHIADFVPLHPHSIPELATIKPWAFLRANL